jgi:hypothetical protein
MSDSWTRARGTNQPRHGVGNRGSAIEALHGVWVRVSEITCIAAGFGHERTCCLNLPAKREISESTFHQ